MKEHTQKRMDEFYKDKKELKEIEQKKGLKKYKVIDIRLKGTNKTEKVNHEGKEHGRMQVLKGNCIDPVRGCPSYANPEKPMCPWDCYSEEAVRRYKIDFGKPISMKLKERLLVKDMIGTQSDWIRIGVDGAPSWNWELTVRCAELVNLVQKVPVIITRMWRTITMKQLQRLIDIGTIIHITVSAADREEILERNLEIAKDINIMGGKVVLRIVTFAYRPGDCREKKQEKMMYQEEIPVLEQPGRLMRVTENTKRKNSLWVEIVHIAGGGGSPERYYLRELHKNLPKNKVRTFYSRNKEMMCSCSSCAKIKEKNGIRIKSVADISRFFDEIDYMYDSREHFVNSHSDEREQIQKENVDMIVKRLEAEERNAERLNIAHNLGEDISFYKKWRASLEGLSHKRKES